MSLPLGHDLRIDSTDGPDGSAVTSALLVAESVQGMQPKAGPTTRPAPTPQPSDSPDEPMPVTTPKETTA